jgi:hypothetical protein
VRVFPKIDKFKIRLLPVKPFIYRSPYPESLNSSYFNDIP